ncbi:calcium sensing receptor [Tasmannia lanceolata]|uniref:calcium sensing receptor n=1 Tax=Tasmannia lanceolata TaxID=3420 RepID=UPI00406414DF
MAFPTAAVASPPPPTLSCAPKLPKPTLKPQFKRTSISPSTSTAISLFTIISTPNHAKALTIPKEQLVTTLTDVENAIDQAVQVGSSVLDFSRGFLQSSIDVLKPGIDIAIPIFQKAGNKALEIAFPAISGASKLAQEALESAGLDPKPVLSVAKTVIDAAQQAPKVIEEAKPIASATVETISSSDPRTIVVTAGALFLTYLILPPLWSVVSFNLRGYKGALTPAQTLDLISTQNHLMVDIRSEKDKSKAGIPRLPSSAKNKMISIPLEELPNKIKGLVRNPKQVEAEIAALKIAYLKRVNKATSIVIMDAYSDVAKITARALTSLGFKNCWIVADGFSGSRGWLQSRLGTDSYNVSFAEVLSPSRVIPASVQRFGTSSSSLKFLPGSADD